MSAAAQRISNPHWWAIGFTDGRRRHVRRLVMGRLLARMEKRKGEHIWPVTVETRAPKRRGLR